MTPEQRRQRARIAALTRWAHDDPRTALASAREAWRERFRVEVRSRHPDLTEAEVALRAERLQRAYYTRLAMRSAAARRHRADRGKE